MRRLLWLCFAIACGHSAVAAPIPLAALLQIGGMDGDEQAVLAEYGFRPYGERTAQLTHPDGSESVALYGDDAEPPRNISVVVGYGAYRDQSRLTYDVHDAAEIRALQAALKQAGFAVADSGAVSRARYVLYRNAAGAEVQVNTPRHAAAATGFVFYRQPAE